MKQNEELVRLTDTDAVVKLDTVEIWAPLGQGTLGAMLAKTEEQLEQNILAQAIALWKEHSANV